MSIMKVALVSTFLDDGYEHDLDDNFMENVVCQEDHFYHRIAHSLSMRNHQPIVFYISVEKKLKKFTHKYGHEIIRVPAKKIPFFHEPFVTSPELINQIGTKFDICHIVSGYYGMYKVPDMFDYVLKRIHDKIPVVARWSGGNHNWMIPIRKNIKKKSLKNCAKIICPGKEERDVLKNVFDIPESNIENLVNPHDLTIFKKREKIEACKKLELEPEKHYFLYVGRLTINKGIEELLDVFNKLQKTNSKISLIFIGDGPSREKIEQFIIQKDLENKIFVKGRLPHEQIAYYYNACSILFHVGISGGLPNVIIEGIASGIPIIASQNNANIDFVNNDLGTGLIVKPGNIEQLENAIETIMNNPEKFAQKIPAKIQEFSYEIFGEKLENLFKKC